MRCRVNPEEARSALAALDDQGGRKRMTKRLLILALAALPALSAPAWGQSPVDDRRWEDAQRRFDTEVAQYQRERERYMSMRRGGYREGPRGGSDRPRYRDDFSTDYDAYREYREDPRARERRLSAEDEVYRGSDGRYYCRRSDGTVGLIVGGVGGALLGNVIDGGRNRAAGTLVGGALGALLGRSVDQNTDVRCR